MKNQNKTILSQRTRRPLRKYQRGGVSYARTTENPAFFWEMRLGKSLTVLRSLVIRFLFQKKKLIVAPYSALYQWTKEFKSEGLTNRDFTLLIGTQKQRAENLKIDTQFYLLNKEGWSSIKQIINYIWQAVIIDESTFLKNPKTGVSNFFCRNFRDAESRWIMTGMPAPESPLDYYQQLKFLDPSILGFKNFYEFRNSLFVQTFQGKYSPTIAGEKYINERLAKHCSYLLREDVDLDIEKIFTKRNVKMKVKAWKTMQTLLREFILETDQELYEVSDSTGFVFANARRVCGGFVKKDFLFPEKMDALVELLKSELAHKQVIIYAEYIDEIKMISKVLVKEKITNNYIYGGNRESRFDILDAFCNGDIQILVGQSVCFKHGVDLSNSDTIIYFSLPMSNETFGQGQDRIVDVSRRFPANIISLVCENTIEEDIYTTMIQKDSKETMHKRIIKRIQETLR